MEQSQQEFLRAAKAELAAVYPNLTWDKFAEMVGIKPRAFKTYRLPSSSSEVRHMEKFKRKAVEDLLEKTRKKTAKGGA